MSWHNDERGTTMGAYMLLADDPSSFAVLIY